MADTKLFIVEGEQKDIRLLKRMTDVFFKDKNNSKIISVPAKQNIFMLYDTLKADDFETDVVEIIRDKVEGAKDILAECSRSDIAEVYLFFDYDIQYFGYSIEEDYEIMMNLFSVFCDETDNGKLFISYPMVESLYDYKSGYCDPFTKCYISIDDFTKYKYLAGKDNPSASKHLEYNDWEEILRTFSMRIRCLFNNSNMDYYSFKSSIEPRELYDKQSTIKSAAKMVFVLSALPEFLFDYYKVGFWSKYTKDKHFHYESCININKRYN